MATVKTLSVWGSSFELKNSLVVDKKGEKDKAMYITKFLGEEVIGITLSTIKLRCAKIAHDEYYKLFVLNKNNDNESLNKRRELFNDNIKSKINSIPSPRRVK